MQLEFFQSAPKPLADLFADLAKSGPTQPELWQCPLQKGDAFRVSQWITFSEASAVFSQRMTAWRGSAIRTPQPEEKLCSFRL